MYAFTIINAYGNKTIPVQFYQKTKQTKRKTTQTQKHPPKKKSVSHLLSYFLKISRGSLFYSAVK